MVLDKGIDIHINSADHYTEASSIKMLEFHVDVSKELHDHIKEENQQYGGNLSVRKKLDKKPLICVGQDEALVHKNQLGHKTWILSNGHKHINPKSGGNAIMGSVFNGHVIGFGLDDRLIDWEKVNEHHPGKKYLDKAAARAELATQAHSQARPLTCYLELV